MTEDIIIPQVGETEDEEVIIREWRKSEGDRVEKGEILLVIEIGKGTVELESVQTGTLVKKLVAENETTYPMKVVGKVETD
jgi:pyruvate/2-oxoglutarate dehydrogenase complex dihydrolipoamide acyltransferase (E2) component